MKTQYITITENGNDSNFNVATIKTNNFKTFKINAKKAIEEHFDGELLDLFNESDYDYVFKCPGCKAFFTIRMEVDGEKVSREIGVSQTWLYETKETPNSFESWHETHYEIVKALVSSEDIEGSTAKKHAEQFGTGGMYDLARELTDKFENQYQGIAWGENLIYHDELDRFLESEL